MLTWNCGDFSAALGFGAEVCDSEIADLARICQVLIKDEAVTLKGPARANELLLNIQVAFLCA